MSIVRTHTKTIGDINYATKTFPATEGLTLWQQLVRIAGVDVLTLLLGLTDEESATVLDDPKVLAAMVVGMAERAKPGEFAEVTKELLRYTTADKVRVGEGEGKGSVFDHYDTHFAGRYGHLLEVCVWVARVGFGGP